MTCIELQVYETLASCIPDLVKEITKLRRSVEKLSETEAEKAMILKKVLEDSRKNS